MYKRRFVRLATTFAALCWVGALPAAAQVSHTFEDGTTQGWGPRGSAVVTNTTEAARTGSRSLKTTNRTAPWNGPALNVLGTLAPNATYRITGYVRLVAGQTADTLKFTVERQPGNSFTQVNTPVSVTDADWVQLQGTFGFSATDATSLVLYLEAAGANTEYYLDDFTIEQVSGPSCPEPLDQTGFTSDFEDGTPQGWVGRGTAVVANVTDDAHTGSRSLRVTGRTAPWNGPTRNVLCKFHNGSSYRVSAWVKLLPGQPASQIRVSLQRTPSAGDNSFHTVIPNTPVTDSAWVNLVVENYTFNLTDVSALELYVESQDGTASFYLDDVRVQFLPPIPIQTDIPQLKEVLADYFPIGAAMEPFQTGGRHAELAQFHFNSITAENAMKFGPLQPTEGNFNWGPADTLADFARQNGMQMHGHTLLWHSQNPGWLFDGLVAGNPDHRNLLIERLRTHITEVVGRYRDVVTSWDVVNEVIDANAPGGLRVTPWLQIIGPEYIDLAFEFAYDADPTARLCINDFNTHQPSKREALWTVVQGLLSRGIPVNCVGHQMHINVVNPPLSEIRATLERFGADARLVNQVTEMDVSAYTNSTDTAPVSEATLVQQGYRYRDIFNLYRELKDIIATVTMWGLADDTTWLRSFPITRPDQPLLFDRNLQAKHAYWGVVDPSMLPVVPQRLGISGGTVHVDGQVDARWQLVSPVSLGADGSLSANFSALWSPTTVYVLVNVMDASKSAGDRVEVFIGSAKHVFEGSGRQKQGVDAKVVPIQGGYRLEAAVPAGQVLDVGQQIRFDIRVTDGGSGDRLSWSDTKHNQDTDTSGLGFLTLMEPMQLSTVPRGTPVIDAVEENAWKQAPELSTDTVVFGSASGATAKVKVLWDAGHLYVFAKVTDPLLSKASNNPWEEDSVEIFVDQNNAKTTSYQGDDMQFRVNFDNEQSFGGAATAAKFQTATRLVDGGYYVEAAIALDVVLQAGAVIGFDVQVNDDGQGNGIRSSVKTWNDTSGNAFQDTSQFGTLKLAVAGMQ